MRYLGIDVSKHKLDCCLLDEAGKQWETSLANDAGGLAKLEKWLCQLGTGKDLKVCMEYTGNYYEAAADYLSRRYFVSVVNPYKIKSFGIAVFSRSKTDKQDARLIAHYAKMMSLEPWQPLTSSQRELRDLHRYLARLKRQRAAEVTKLQTAPDCLAGHIREQVAYLSGKIKTVERQIADCLQRDDDYREKSKRLQTIPGIGKNSAAVLLALLDDGRFEHAGQLVAYLGLDPRHRQSGTSLHGKSRISKFGQAELRTALYMPAMAAYRKGAFKPFVDRLAAAGKPPMVIIVALMRKLAVIAFYLMKTQTDFEPRRYTN